MVAHGLTTTLDRLLSAERTVVYANDRSVASVASETKRIFMPLLELIQVYSAQDCQTLCMSKQKGSALIISGARHSRETVALIHILQLYKTYTLCITSEHGSECALAADDTLYVGTTRADAPPDATRTPVVAPYLLAIEMLYLSLREHTLRSHPGLAAVSQANVE